MILDGHIKGYPVSRPPVALQDFGDLGLSLFQEGLSYPMAVLLREALMHNIAWMQQYAQRKGVVLAPHGKTTMSPELFQIQLDQGAWGMTFADVHQLQIGVEAGVRRSIIANQVVSQADLHGLTEMLSAHDDLRVWFLVDSLEQLSWIESWHASNSKAGSFDVLIEMGVKGQRTGCRNLKDALTLASAISCSSATRLCGLSCYEGLLANCQNAHDVQAVTEFIRAVLDVARHCDLADLFEDSSILLSAGGSAVFDLVIPLLLGEGLSRPVLGVLRSGCYIAHDHGFYHRFLLNVQHREGLLTSLRPALEIWAMVQSVPEPGLALLTCGRRDISFDQGLPIPLRLIRHRQKMFQACPTDWHIGALNDHHAYLRYDPMGLRPEVGDRIGLGGSHPCTTFDKWRWLAFLEEDGRLSGAVHTHF